MTDFKFAELTLENALGGTFLVGIGTLATTPVPIGSALEAASARA